MPCDSPSFMRCALQMPLRVSRSDPAPLPYAPAIALEALRGRAPPPHIPHSYNQPWYVLGESVAPENTSLCGILHTLLW